MGDVIPISANDWSEKNASFVLLSFLLLGLLLLLSADSDATLIGVKDVVEEKSFDLLLTITVGVTVTVEVNVDVDALGYWEADKIKDLQVCTDADLLPVFLLVETLKTDRKNGPLRYRCMIWIGN